MLRTLLADRFRMVARNTTARLEIYALTLARNDGALGPALRRTQDIDCVRFIVDRGGELPPLPRDPKDVPTCIIRAEPGLIVARARTMLDLTKVAFPRVVEDRVVVDRTGLKGNSTCSSSGHLNHGRLLLRTTCLQVFRSPRRRPWADHQSSRRFRNSLVSSCNPTRGWSKSC